MTEKRPLTCRRIVVKIGTSSLIDAATGQIKLQTIDRLAFTLAALNHQGCDMVLVCNRPDLAVQLLDRWHPAVAAGSAERIAALRPRQGNMPADPATLAGWAPYCQARDSVLALA